MTQHNGLRTWIEISIESLRHNYSLFRGIISPSTKLMAVVKSNAYGHSILDYAKNLDAFGVDFFGVDSVVEAEALRKDGIQKPLLVLGYTLPERFSEAHSKDISFTISSHYHIRMMGVSENKVPLKVHLKLDTGMHRQGFMVHEMESLISVLREAERSGRLKVEGVYTHFSSAKNPAAPQSTFGQIDLFKEMAKKIEEGIGHAVTKHAAATGGALLFPEAHFDMVRIGIGFTGLWPSLETRHSLHEKYSLKPILSWKTIISEVKKIPAGSTVGYDQTEAVKRDTMLAICPVGYWHGFRRSLSSVGSVFIGGHSCRVLGRVSMDMIIIDCTDLRNVAVLDEVVLIDAVLGNIYEMAEASATSHYEIVTQLNPLMRRIYL